MSDPNDSDLILWHISSRQVTYFANDDKHTNYGNNKGRFFDYVLSIDSQPKLSEFHIK